MKLRKKIFVLVIFFLVLGIAGSWYLEKIFLPEKIKTLTVSFLKEKFELETSLKAVNFSFWKGIELEEFKVNNPSDFEKEKLLELKKAVLKPALLPLLRKRLVISKIIIDEPNINLERNQKGIWNIGRFLPSFKNSNATKKETKEKQFSLKVSKIQIYKGNITLIDKGIEPSFTREIKNLNLNISTLGPHLALTYNLNFLLDPDQAIFQANGKIFPLVKRGGLNLDIEHLNLGELSPYLEKFTTFSFDKGYLDLNIELSASENGLNGDCQFDLSQIVFYLKDVYNIPLIFSKGEISSQIHINNEKEEIQLEKTIITLDKFNINGDGQVKSFRTNPELTFHFSTPLLDLKDITFIFPTVTLDFYKSLKAEGPFKISEGLLFVPFKKMSETDYKLFAELQKVKFSPSFLKSKINNLEGKLSLDRKEVKTENLKGEIEKLFFSVSGTSGLKPPAKINISLPFQQFKLEDLGNVLKKNFEKIVPPLSFTGQGEGNIQIRGDFKKLGWLSSLKIIEGTITHPDWKDRIEGVNGTVEFSENSISSKALKGSWKNTPLTLSGKVQNFNQPRIELELTGSEIQLSSQAQLFKDSGKLINLSGTYQGTPIKAEGSFKKLNPLIVDFNLESSPIELEKLAKILPSAFMDVYKNLELSSVANFRSNLQGELLNWEKWKAKGNFNFSKFHAYKCNLREFSFSFNLDQQKLSLPDIRAVFCGGSIHGNFQINLAEAHPSFSGNSTLSNIDLARVSQETDWKDLDIQGIANSEINFNGFGSDWNRLKGRGWIHLQGSRLWEIPLLGELANILLIPGLDKTIIQEGHCNFNIAQGRIYTKDLEFLSENLSLKAEGSAGFDTTLDFDILMQFSGALRNQASNLTKLADSVLKTVEKLLIQIKLKGTIAQPKYIIQPFPVDKILEREIKRKIGDFLQDLLEDKKE